MKLLCMTSSASMGEDGLREENEKPADVGFLSTLTHSRAMSLWSCMYQAHNSCTCMTDYSLCILSLHLVLSCPLIVLPGKDGTGHKNSRISEYAAPTGSPVPVRYTVLWRESKLPATTPFLCHLPLFFLCHLPLLYISFLCCLLRNTSTEGDCIRVPNSTTVLLYYYICVLIILYMHILA
jgi:hypothetical protein